MLNDKQGQEQSQYINFAEKHGIVDSAFCQYFTSDVVNALMSNVRRGGVELETKVAKELHNAKMVRLIVYEGKTTKIYCHLLSNGKCTSPLNNSDDKVCILK